MVDGRAYTPFSEIILNPPLTPLKKHLTATSVDVQVTGLFWMLPRAFQRLEDVERHG
jgi:hypothetical protein